MRRHPRPAALTAEAAVGAAALVSIPAVALPIYAGGILVSVTDVAVGAALAAAAVLMFGLGDRMPSPLLGAASLLWTVVGLASLLPPAAEVAVSRAALVPHALVLLALVATGRPVGIPAGANRAWWWLLSLVVVAAALAAGAGRLDNALLVMGAAALPAGAGRVLAGRRSPERVLGSLTLVLGTSWLGVGLLRALTASQVGLAPGIVDLGLVVAALGMPLADGPGRLWRAAAEAEEFRAVTATHTLLARRLGEALGTGPVDVWFASSRGLIDADGQRAEPEGTAPDGEGGTPEGERAARDGEGALSGGPWPFTDTGRVVAFTDRPLQVGPAVHRELVQVLDRAGAIASLRAEQRATATAIDRSRADLLLAADRERGELEHRLRQTALARLERLESMLPVASGAELRGRVATVRADLLGLARGLDPLGDQRLPEAIRGLVAHLPGARATVTGSASDLPRVAARALFYVCAEGLANAAKHAAGSAVEVTLEVDRSGDLIVLTVTDDGPGGAAPTGRGLRGLADRVEALGGTLTLSTMSTGTRLSARVPRGVLRKYGSPLMPIGVCPDEPADTSNLASWT